MMATDHAERHAALSDSMARSHDAWGQASMAYQRVVTDWFSDVIDALLVAAGDERIAIHETFGTTCVDSDLQVVAFTDSTRIDLRTKPLSAGGGGVLTAVYPRRELRKVEVLRIGGVRSDAQWPSTVTIRLTYPSDVVIVLGAGGYTVTNDTTASQRLAGFYPSLLADLNHP